MNKEQKKICAQLEPFLENILHSMDKTTIKVGYLPDDMHKLYRTAMMAIEELLMEIKHD
jgi:hypothetical protein